MATEKNYPTSSGWTMLFVCIAGGLLAIVLFITGAVQQSPVLIVIALLLGVGVVISSVGLFAQQPNMAVMLLFGEYRGTVRDTGFFWANPFVIRKPISLRLRNLEGSLLKVNDKQGNPIEIAAVVVWRVQDTARAASTSPTIDLRPRAERIGRAASRQLVRVRPRRRTRDHAS